MVVPIIAARAVGGRVRRGKGTVAYRVNIVNIAALIGTSLVIDGLQPILLFTITILTAGIGAFMGFVASIFVSIIAFGIFWFWFRSLKVSYFSGKKVGTKLAWSFGALLLELTPLAFFPATTVGVVGVILASRSEDRLAAEGPATQPVRVQLPQPANDALPEPANDNEAGIREAA